MVHKARDSDNNKSPLITTSLYQNLVAPYNFLKSSAALLGYRAIGYRYSLAVRENIKDQRYNLSYLDLVPSVPDGTLATTTGVDRWQLSLHRAKLGSFRVGLL